MQRQTFFDITWERASGQSVKFGRITFNLYDDCPLTAENFVQLCTGRPGFGYKGSHFSTILEDYLIQGGDTSITHNSQNGNSIYGEKFDDENFLYNHVKPGILSMVNAGKNTNGSQFFITIVPLPNMDGKHVVFGEVTHGMDILMRISRMGRPLHEGSIFDGKVVIGDCGEL